MGDPELAGFFAGTNMNRLKGRQVEFFAEALGAPVTYSGASMHDAHVGRGIGQQHFDLVAGHLVSSLAAAGVGEGEIKQIVAAVAPLADDIVAGS
jgi:hemoglobin